MNEHRVRLYRDSGALAAEVAQFARAGLARGDAVVIIATEPRRAAFLEELDYKPALSEGRLNLLDAGRTLARFMANGMPQWPAFEQVIGGLIVRLRERHPALRAYGEMVDVLWQRGARAAALRLEEYWNELGRLQEFALFCAYRMDPLDPASYDGALQCVCHTHTHVMPARDPARFDAAVRKAAEKVLERPLAQMLFSLAARHKGPAHMPAGQATLLWLHQNMPRTAERVLSELRAGPSPAA